MNEGSEAAFASLPGAPHPATEPWFSGGTARECR